MNEMDHLVVIDDFAVGAGGQTQLALLSAKQARLSGITVTYISGDAGGNTELEDFGIEIITAGNAPLIKQDKIHAAVNGIFDFRTKNLISHWILRNDSPHTIYHLHGWAQTLSPAVFAALRPVRQRVILHAHDYFLLCPNGAFYDYPTAELCTRTPLSISCLSKNCDKRSYSQKLWRSARQISLRLAFNIATMPACIVLIHQGMAPVFLRAGVPLAKLVTVRNPITPYSPTRIHAENNSDVIFVGRVQAEKGIEDLIAAIAIAGGRLVVIGDGPLKHPLAQQHPHVVFTGWQNRDEIAARAVHARLLAMPSRYPEPFGLVCLEAATAGIPIIVPPSALLARDVAANGIGYVCNTRDHAAFANVLGQALRDNTTIKKMSEAAHARAATLAPSPAAWGAELQTVYRQALPQPQAA
jgi:glycosyltransferase involved in cell wall biosynthesis